MSSDVIINLFQTIAIIANTITIYVILVRGK